MSGLPPVEFVEAFEEEEVEECEGEEEEDDDDDDDDDDDEDPEHQLVIDEVGRVEFKGAIPTLEAGAAAWDAAIPAETQQRCIDWASRAAVRREVGRNKAYSRGATYWIGADATPACGPEKLALDIFRHHTRGCEEMRAKQSGAEWWTLVLDEDSEVGWHWDKDYALESSMKLNVYPQVGTVTYFTDSGCPTVAARCAAPPLIEDKLPTEAQQLWVCHPRPARHFAFDGRFLHAAREIAHKPLAKGARRVTLLVNVWVNHKPVSAARFKTAPEEAASFRAADWPSALSTAGELQPVKAAPTEAAEPFEFTGPGGVPVRLVLRLPAAERVSHATGCGVFAVEGPQVLTLEERSTEQPRKRRKALKSL